jgi:signal transduction histidine kinase
MSRPITDLEERSTVRPMRERSNQLRANPNAGYLRRVHLPTGAQLPVAEYDARHQIILGVLVALMPFLAFVGVVEHHPIERVLIDILVAVGVPTAIATWLRPARRRRMRSLAAAFGLMAAGATLVHLWNGKIEAHFLFFVLLPLVALYQDWLPFLVATAVVLLHHAVLGVIRSSDVYNHHAAQAAPVTWALIHAAFVVALIGVLIIYWNAAESGQRTLGDAMTELQTTQHHLVQAQKLESIGELAAGVAHEINTPIQFVGDNLRFLETSFLDLLALVESLDVLLDGVRRDGSDALIAIADHVGRERDEHDLDYLVAEIPLALAQSSEGIDRVAEIVRALKGVAYPNTDKVATADINDLVHNTVVVTRNEWKHDAVVRTELDPDMPPVECLAGPLGQVFVNMIVNAVHAVQERFGAESHEHGELVVSTHHTDDSIQIRFSDNGNGIPDDVRSRVFDPFFTTKPMGKGTGQGLAISYSVVVAQHAGSITVDSEVGIGTTFTVQLPIRSTHASKQAA